MNNVSNNRKSTPLADLSNDQMTQSGITVAKVENLVALAPKSENHKKHHLKTPLQTNGTKHQTITPNYDRLKKIEIEPEKTSLRTLGLSESACHTVQQISKTRHCGDYFGIIDNIAFYLHSKFEELLTIEKNSINIDLVRLSLTTYENILSITLFSALAKVTTQGVKDPGINKHLQDVLPLDLGEMLDDIKILNGQNKQILYTDDFKDSYRLKFIRFNTSIEKRYQELLKKFLPILQDLDDGIDILTEIFKLPSEEFNEIINLQAHKIFEWDCKNEDKISFHKELSNIKTSFQKILKSTENERTNKIQLALAIDKYAKNFDHITTVLSVNNFNERKVLQYFSEIRNIFASLHKDSLCTKIVPENSIESAYIAFSPSHYLIYKMQYDNFIPLVNIAIDDFYAKFLFNVNHDELEKLKNAWDNLHKYFIENPSMLIQILSADFKEKLLSIKELENCPLIHKYFENIFTFTSSIKSIFYQNLKNDFDSFFVINDNNEFFINWLTLKENISPLQEAGLLFKNEMKKLNLPIHNMLTTCVLYTTDIDDLEKKANLLRFDLTEILLPLLEFPTAFEKLISVTKTQMKSSKKSSCLAVNTEIKDLFNFDFKKLLTTAIVPKATIVTKIEPLPVQELISEEITTSEEKSDSFAENAVPKEVETLSQDELELRINVPRTKKVKELLAYLITNKWLPGSICGSHLKMKKGDQMVMVPINVSVLPSGTASAIRRQIAEAETVLNRCF